MLGLNVKKLARVPAIIVIAVTFSLGIASARSISTLLQIGWLFWPLVIGFTTGEFLVIAWFKEPEEGKYTKKQMRGIQSAKYIIMGAGLIDGILLIIQAKTGGGTVALSAVQAGVSLLAIFYAAGASMYLIDNDAERLIAIEKADTNLRYMLEKARVDLQLKLNSLKVRELEVKTAEKSRADISRYTIKHLNSPEMQERMSRAGERLALGIVEKFERKIEQVLPVGQGGSTSKKVRGPLHVNGNGQRATV